MSEKFVTLNTKHPVFQPYKRLYNQHFRRFFLNKYLNRVIRIIFRPTRNLNAASNMFWGLKRCSFYLVYFKYKKKI
jgi:hypothetical protein